MNWNLMFCICVVFGHLALADEAGSSSSEQEISYKIGSPLVLNCTLPDPTVTWKKNVTYDITLKENSVSMFTEGGVHYLKFEKPQVNEVGTYSCAGATEKRNFKVTMDPYIHKIPQSANVVEGEKYSLLCEVYGTPPITLSWTKCDDNKPIQGGDEAYQVANNTLLIKSIKPDDRCNYTCTAKNDLGQEYSRTIFIRVVDKYAALWPFLGICAEVIVLCLVIFIYEKRRSKTEFDEGEVDQNNDAKHVGNAKDSEVRQRK